MGSSWSMPTPKCHNITYNNHIGGEWRVGLIKALQAICNSSMYTTSYQFWVCVATKGSPWPSINITNLSQYWCQPWQQWAWSMSVHVPQNDMMSFWIWCLFTDTYFLNKAPLLFWWVPLRTIQWLRKVLKDWQGGLTPRIHRGIMP